MGYPFAVGAEIRIDISFDSRRYESVVPVSAVSNEGAAYYVYAIFMRPSYWEDEYYVQKVKSIYSTITSNGRR